MGLTDGCCLATDQAITPSDVELPTARSSDQLYSKQIAALAVRRTLQPSEQLKDIQPDFSM